MRWIVLVPVAVAVAGGLGLGACGGPKVPMHSGYKSEKAKPWNKPKVLQFDEKLETKTDGDLSYKDYKRARWYAVDLPTNAELSLKLEITPPGEAVNEDFDLAVEVLDQGYRVISKSDLEESDAGELAKTKTLLDLRPGRYLIHVYLQGRMDTAEYELRVAYRPTAPAEVKTTFPAEVEFVEPLAMVPATDDTPKNYKPPTTVVRSTVRRPPPVTKKPEAPAPVGLPARITSITVVNNKTQVTIGRGTANDVANGMTVRLSNGMRSTLSDCSDRRCKASFDGTVEQIRSAGDAVMITP